MFDFQDNMSMSQASMPFPENLADLMNSGTAPNVTLQPNQSQMPSPMSPRYQTMQRPPQSPKIGPGPVGMMGPNPQLSPSFQQQQQWNNSNIGIPPQVTAAVGNSHYLLQYLSNTVRYV